MAAQMTVDGGGGGSCDGLFSRPYDILMRPNDLKNLFGIC